MSTAQRIDVHHHVVPPVYREALQRVGSDAAGGRHLPDWSPQASLDLMDRNGISTAILSVTTPGVEPWPGQEGRDLARALNEHCAELVRDHPGRFGFWATLTLPDVDGALAEAEYALDELGADGVVLLANSGGTYLGDEAFEPLLAELGRRGAVVFVHPSALPADPVPGIPPFAADFLLDTTRAVAKLAASGTLHRHPDLKVVLSHAGGFLPYAAERIAACLELAGSERSTADVLTDLRRCYFDTALSASPYALPGLTAFADPERILFGSDFPYAPAEIATTMTERLDASPVIDHAAVDRENAARLLPRHS